MDAKKISSIYSDVVLPVGETIHPRARYSVFASMCEFSDKDIKFTKVVMCVTFFALNVLVYLFLIHKWILNNI